MAKYMIENEKYIIRPIEESDAEHVKNILRDDRYIKKLWENESMTNLVDFVIKSAYIDYDNSYCIVSKETGEFCGYIANSPDKNGDEEGEISIKLAEEETVDEIMGMLGDVFREIGHRKTKSINLQYSFD